MERAEIYLHYGLDMKSHLYRGSIWRRNLGVKEPYQVTDFEDLRYSQMMAKLAAKIREVGGNAAVIFSRLEADGEIPLDDSMVQLLNEDPAAAIRLMDHPERTVVVRDKPETETLLRAGHDTLADAFGDFLYCCVRWPKIECPFCGRWTMFHPQKEDKPLSCDHCNTIFPGTVEMIVNLRQEMGWCLLSTRDLLSTKKERYFLPRTWNESSSWVSHEELKQKYETYLKEKKECLVQQDDRPE